MSGIITFGIDVLVAPSPRLVGAAVGCAIGSAALFALGPAWSLSKPDVASDLKVESGQVSRRGNSWPVVAQLAASLALVVAAGLFTRGAVNAAAIDAGFPMVRQLVVEVDPSLAGYDRARTRGTYQTALQRLRNTPGVERASFASTVAFGDIMMSGRASLPPQAAEIDATFDVIGSDYFDTLGLRMVRGREFTLAEEQTDSGPPDSPWLTGIMTTYLEIGYVPAAVGAVQLTFSEDGPATTVGVPGAPIGLYGVPLIGADAVPLPELSLTPRTRTA